MTEVFDMQNDHLTGIPSDVDLIGWHNRLDLAVIRDGAAQTVVWKGQRLDFSPAGLDPVQLLASACQHDDALVNETFDNWASVLAK